MDWIFCRLTGRRQGRGQISSESGPCDPDLFYPGAYSLPWPDLGNLYDGLLDPGTGGRHQPGREGGSSDWKDPASEISRVSPALPAHFKETPEIIHRAFLRPHK